MKAFLRPCLLLSFFLGISTLMAPASYAVTVSSDSEATLDLEEAENFGLEAQDLLKDAHMMGTVGRGRPDHEELFLHADALTQELFDDKNYEVTELSRFEDRVQFVVKNPEGKIFYLTSIIEAPVSPVSSPKKNSSPSAATYLVANTQLVIEESLRQDSKTNFFTSIVTGHRAQDRDVTRVHGGFKKGAFTLSLFGSPLKDGIKGGVNSSLRLQSASGWGLTVVGIVSESFKSGVDVHTGKYRSLKSKNPDAFTLFQVDRVWKATNIKTAAGFTLYWKEISSDVNPDATAFVSLGKSFTLPNSKGKGAIELLLSSKVNSARPNNFIGLRISIDF